MNYRISKEAVEKYFQEAKIEALDYESPIALYTKELARDIAKRTDETIITAVREIGVDVDKNELIKALQYDRYQYEKGFQNGYKAAVEKLPLWAKILLKRRMEKK